MNKDLFIFNIIIALAALGGLGYLIWQVDLDMFGLLPPAVSDMNERPAPPLAPPPGAVSFGEESPAESGAVLFERHCAVCHGLDGSGKSYVASIEGMPGVADLRTLGQRDEEELLQSLREGKGGAMPAFGLRLRPAEINAVFLHCLSLIHGNGTPAATSAATSAPKP